MPKTMKDEKRICDMCNNFECSPCGSREICHAKKEGSNVIKWLDYFYAEQRMSGEKMTCKGFKKIQTNF